MEENITPEESLLLITKTIGETKKRLEENGHIIIMFGILTFIVFLSQYIFIQIGWYKLFDIAWTNILFPLGAIYAFIYYRKKVKKKNLPKTYVGSIMRIMALVFFVNGGVLGLIFGHQLGKANAPVAFILIALFIIMLGVTIKFKPLIIGGFILNLMGFSTFYINGQYHALMLAIGAVIAMIIPGILLTKAKRKENV